MTLDDLNPTDGDPTGIDGWAAERGVRDVVLIVTVPDVPNEVSDEDVRVTCGDCLLRDDESNPVVAVAERVRIPAWVAGGNAAVTAYRAVQP